MFVLLTAVEVNMIKAMIEGGAGESLYNRLKWDEPKRVRLSRGEIDVLSWHLTENSHLRADHIALLRRILKSVYN